MRSNVIKLALVLAVCLLAFPVVKTFAGSVPPASINDKVAKLGFEDLKRLFPVTMSIHTNETWGEIAKVTVAGVEYTLPFIVGDDDVFTWYYMKEFLPKEVADKPTSGQPNDEQIFFYVTKLAEAADQNATILIRKDFEANKAKYMLLYPNVKGDMLFTEVFDRYRTDENAKTAPEAQKAYNEFVSLTMLSSALSMYIALKEKL